MVTDSIEPMRNVFSRNRIPSFTVNSTSFPFFLTDRTAARGIESFFSSNVPCRTFNSAECSSSKKTPQAEPMHQKVRNGRVSSTGAKAISRFEASHRNPAKAGRKEYDDMLRA